MREIVNIAGQLLAAFALMWLSGLTSLSFAGINLPISLQSMMAVLLPLIFRANIAIAAVALYLVLGALGLPVFATGVGGWRYFYSTSGGYLVGFFVIAGLTSLFKGYIKGNTGFIVTFLIFIGMHVVLTILGTGWLFINGVNLNFNRDVSPYMPGTVIKSIIGAVISEGVRYLRNRKTSETS